MKVEKQHLLNIVYGYEPMTRQLAEQIQDLRCERKASYEHIAFYLNEGFGSDFSLGKELCQKARQFLKDENKSWD